MSTVFKYYFKLAIIHDIKLQLLISVNDTVREKYTL